MNKILGRNDNTPQQQGEAHGSNAEIGETIQFQGGKEEHTLHIEMLGGFPVAMVASQEEPVKEKIIRWRKIDEQNGYHNKGLLDEADQLLSELNKDAVEKKREDDREAHSEAGSISESNGNAGDGGAEGIHAKEITKQAEEKLAEILAQLFTIFGESAAQMPFKVGDFIKTVYLEVQWWVAEITNISGGSVTFRYLDDRKGERTVTIKEFLDQLKNNQTSAYTEDKRGLFMGSNPDRNGPVGQAVRVKMGTAYRKINYTEEIYSDVEKKWFNIDECDLSHEPTDAVTYWNHGDANNSKYEQPGR